MPVDVKEIRLGPGGGEMHSTSVDGSAGAEQTNFPQTLSSRALVCECRLVNSCRGSLAYRLPFLNTALS